MEVGRILNLKQSNQIVKYSEEGHSQKAKLLIKPLAKETLKILSQLQLESEEAVVQRALRMISLLVLLIQASKTAFKVELNDKVKLALTTLIGSKKVTQLQTYVLAKFICLSEQSGDLKQLIYEQVSEAHGKYEMDLTKLIRENFVLSSYGPESLNHERFTAGIDEVIDFRNKGYVEAIPANTELLLASEDGKLLKIEHADNLLALKGFKSVEAEQRIQDVPLFNALSGNLSKNSRELRLETLRVQLGLFAELDYLTFDANHSRSDLDIETVRSHYSGPCPIMHKLYEYERSKLGFETEKSKDTVLRQVSVILSTGLVPEQYVLAVYHMMIGSLWLKFVPCHQSAMEVLQQVFRLNPDKFLAKHLDLLE